MKHLLCMLFLAIPVDSMAQDVPLADTLRDAIVTPLTDMPEHVPAAIIAAEDKAFRDRRTWQSTITAHLSRLTMAPADSRDAVKRSKHTFKLIEILDHNGILEAYLNIVYFGRGATGIEAAALAYFGVSAKDLSPSQAVFLAMMIKAPTHISSLDRDQQQDRYEFVRAALLDMRVLNMRDTTHLTLSQMPTPVPD